MLGYCPAAQSPKGGDHALLQYVTVHVGSTHDSPDHDTPKKKFDHADNLEAFTEFMYQVLYDIQLAL